MVVEPLHPGELVGKLVRIHGVAVGQIDRGDAHTADHGLDVARLGVIIVARQRRDDILDGTLGEDGDAVVALLSHDCGIVAEITDLELGKAFGDGLDFLQQRNVGRGFGEPLEHARQARLDRVHVPGGDFHRARLQAQKRPLNGGL